MFFRDKVISVWEEMISDCLLSPLYENLNLVFITSGGGLDTITFS